MAVPSTPTNLYVQPANRTVYLSWDLTATATSYSVQRSTDGVTYTTVASPVINSYTDTTVTVGTLYYYQVAATNGSGTGTYTSPQQVVPAPTSEMSLLALRLAAQQRADRVNSNFVTLPEWNSYINQAMFQLYDILIDTYEDYFLAPVARFSTQPNQFIYSLPDGATNFLDPNNNSFTAAPFYKLRGVDLSVNSANNANVTLSKFSFEARNNYVYPNTASTIYGVFNLQYRLMGNNIEFIPTPSSGQIIQLWYIPRLPELVKDTDITTIGISGFLEYVIVRAAILALTKEESDVSSLVLQLADIEKHIQESAMNRDVGRPETVTDTRRGMWGQQGAPFGWNGTWAGWTVLLGLSTSLVHILGSINGVI